MEKVYIVNHLFVDYESPADSCNDIEGVYKSIEDARSALREWMHKNLAQAFDGNADIDRYMEDIKQSDDCYIDENQGQETYNEIRIIETYLK